MLIAAKEFWTEKEVEKVLDDELTSDHVFKNTWNKKRQEVFSKKFKDELMIKVVLAESLAKRRQSRSE